MSGRQFQLLRALAKGDLYEPAAGLVLGVSDTRIRAIANEAVRSGFVTRNAELTLALTEKGREQLAAWSP